MNVEWWGGEQSSPPCRLQVGAPPRLGSAFAELFCYLCASVVK